MNTYFFIRNPWILIASIILFIELLDATILYSCGVPISQAFGRNVTEMTLPILAYIIGTCIFIPCTSWLIYRYESTALLCMVLLLFALSSFLCGISTNFYFFSFYRFIQGIAISISASVAMVILLMGSAKNELTKIMGIINVPALVGTALGPLLGAIFSYYLSWRVVFFVNIPVCMILIFFLWFLPKEKKNTQTFGKKTIIDIYGLLMISLFLGITSVALELLQNHLKMENFLLLLLGVLFGLIYFLLWKFREYAYRNKSNSSILDLKVFNDGNFILGSLVNIFSRIAMCGIPMLLSILLQEGYLFSVIKSGIYLSIIALGAITAKCFSSNISKIGIHRSLIASVMFVGFCILSFIPIDLWIDKGLLWFICYCFGFFMSLLYTSMNSVFFISLEETQIPNATSIVAIIQQFSLGLGIVVAIGGFRLLLSWKKVPLEQSYHQNITTAFSLTCEGLFACMFISLLVAYFFYVYQKKFSLINKP